MDSTFSIGGARRYYGVLCYSFIASIAVMTFGIDSGETSGFLAMPSWLRDFGSYEPLLGIYIMSARDQTRMYGIELGLAMVGAVMAGILGNRYGRKVGLAVTAILCILGASLQMIRHTPGLLVGRGIMGLGVGAATVLAIAYITEVTPMEIRGPLVAFYQIFTDIASLIGTLVNQGTHDLPTAMAYRIPLIVATIVPFLLLLTVWFLPEAPRWLVTRGRNTEAMTNLRKIRGKTYSAEELECELNETIVLTTIEKELEDSTSFYQCFTGTELRRTVIAMVLFGGQQLTGTGFIGGYLTFFFALVGYTNAFAIAVISASCGIAGALSALFFIKWFGRRTILIAGAAVMAFCMVTFSIISVAASPHSTAAARSVIAFICIFTYAYAASWGAVVPVVAGEIPSNRLRSKSLALSLGTNWIFSLLVICGVPYLISPDYANLGTKIGFVFGALTVPLVLFAALFVPETKGRTLEEIDEMFLKGVSARKFAGYVCTGTVGEMSMNNVLRALEEKAALGGDTVAVVEHVD